MENSQRFQKAVADILEICGEDSNREGLKDTPKRVYKSFQYLLSGYQKDAKSIIQSALFASSNDQMVVVKDIEFYSLCEHHILPIIGKAHIAYIPNGKVIGLSKMPRVVNVFARRLQIQEQLTEQIADAINDAIAPKGVGVVIDARHMCMEMRGVQKSCSKTVTSALRGIFRKEPTRKEFFSIINSNSSSNF